MSRFMFENLDVYQKAVDLSDRVLSLTENFPKDLVAISKMIGGLIAGMDKRDN